MRYLACLFWALVSLVFAGSVAINLFSFSMADRAVMVALVITFGYQSYKRYIGVK